MNVQAHLAPHGKRFMAYLIDIVPIVLAVFSISYLFLDFGNVSSIYFYRGDNSSAREAFIKQRNLIRESSFLIWIIYCAVKEMSPKQGTWGKQLMGIKVINQHGYKLNSQESIARSFAKMVCYFIFPIIIIWILFDKNRQGLHDKFHKTFVVNQDFSPQLEDEFEEEID